MTNSIEQNHEIIMLYKKTKIDLDKTQSFQKKKIEKEGNNNKKLNIKCKIRCINKSKQQPNHNKYWILWFDFLKIWCLHYSYLRRDFSFQQVFFYPSTSHCDTPINRTCEGLISVEFIFQQGEVIVNKPTNNIISNIDKSVMG